MWVWRQSAALLRRSMLGSTRSLLAISASLAAVELPRTLSDAEFDAERDGVHGKAVSSTNPEISFAAGDDGDNAAAANTCDHL